MEIKVNGGSIGENMIKEGTDPKMPAVSVILPVYNTRIYLEEALHSVTGQTFKNMEIICIDDGSTDGSLTELRRWEEKDGRIRVYTQLNQGLSAARNAGLKRAAGKYVYFMDSDDILMPSAIWEAYEECESKELDVTCFSSEDVTSDGRIIPGYVRKGRYPYACTGMELMSEMVKNDEWYPTVWIQFYRKAYLDEIRIRFIDGILHEDNPYTFEAVLRAGRASCLNRVLYRKRLREGSITMVPLCYKNVLGLFTGYLHMRKLFDETECDTRASLKTSCLRVLDRHIGFIRNYYCRIPYVERPGVAAHVEEPDLFRELIEVPLEKERISVIIIFHDQEAYVKRCLGSVTCQSWQNIEIICVDDASSDRTGELLKKYENADNPNLKVISLRENKSENVARKTGVRQAEGKYILFLDGDDTLEPNACEILINEMEKDPVDILQYGIRYFKSDGSETFFDENEYFNRIYPERLKGEEVFEKCFNTYGYSFSIWNKLYRSGLVKEAFSHVDDSFLPYGADRYHYMMIASAAGSYRGIGIKLIDHYVDTGISSKRVNRDKYMRILRSADVADAAWKHFNKVDNAVFLQGVRQLREDLFHDCLTKGMSAEGVDPAEVPGLLAGCYGAVYTVGRLYSLYREKPEDLLSLLNGSAGCKQAKRQINTIGLYYYRLRMGGTERVMAGLARLWSDMGYRVILLTEEQENKDDYEVPEECIRVVIPSEREVRVAGYEKRAEAISDVIREYAIDSVVYNAWISESLLWDMLICKLSGSMFIIHCHNVFSQPAMVDLKLYTDLPYIYSFADSVVTLSNTDRTYWESFNDKVFTMPNPMGFKSMEEIPASTLDGKILIWCQRISPEKNPMDVLEVLRLVTEMEAEAELWVVGSGDDPSWEAAFDRRIHELGLSDKVTRFGYQRQVYDFYKRADVCIITSELEGFPMGLVESMSAGVPVVMYDLPYLTMLEKGKGIITVKKHDKEEMADRIISLLSDPEGKRKLGREAREAVAGLLDFDYEGEWRRIFEEAANGEGRHKRMPLMWEVLLEHVRNGLRVRSGNAASELNDIQAVLSSHEEVLYRHEEVVNRHEEVVNRHEEVVNRHEEVVNRHEEVVNRHEEVVNRHEEVVNRHEEVVNRHEEVVNRHEEVVNRHEEVVNRHEEVVNRHEEVVNRHEEVVNRHEDVVNRHEISINHQWEVQKWHEKRLQKLEDKPFYCPCCGNSADSPEEAWFHDYPEIFDVSRYKKKYRRVICPFCKSLPRQRIQAEWMTQNIDLIRDKRILHFAPEDSLRIWFERNGIRPVTADLYETADLRLDIQDTGLPDCSYDIIICNHILEHVDDCKKAIKELKRILTDDGFMIISFPVDRRYRYVHEDPSITSDEERIRAFGQKDHVRVFGRNSRKLLASFGLNVEEIRGNRMPSRIVPVTGPADYDINILYLCRKSYEK